MLVRMSMLKPWPVMLPTTAAITGRAPNAHFEVQAISRVKEKACNEQVMPNCVIAKLYVEGSDRHSGT